MTTHALRKDMVTHAEKNATTTIGDGDRRDVAAVEGRRLPKRYLAGPRPKAWLHLLPPYPSRWVRPSASSAQSQTPVCSGAGGDLQGAQRGLLASQRGESARPGSVDRATRSSAKWRSRGVSRPCCGRSSMGPGKETQTLQARDSSPPTPCRRLETATTMVARADCGLAPRALLSPRDERVPRNHLQELVRPIPRRSQ